MSTPFAPGLNAQKTRAQVAVHEGAFETCLQKKLYQVIKEDRFVRPGELLRVFCMAKSC
jgi:hypothetical protein